MARAATTEDVFNAIAEPRRREVLLLLGNREWAVNDLVAQLGWKQPIVSKHLGVLRQVGLVSVRREGRRQIYSLNPQELKTVHDWVSMFEQFWGDHLNSIKAVAEAKARDMRAKKN
jgi:DNA-binding transcriptional ArsR family regulator